MAFARIVRFARGSWPAIWRVLLTLSAAYAAHAGGPRWVTGPPYFTVDAGRPVAFYTADVRYYTDPGNLSLQVSHAAADAMVANAAAVWNVGVARLTLAQGGALSEHVSATNTYFDGTRLQVPADVQPSNYISKPIAVIYDTDGSVIDTLLGSGASAPASCRQNGVVEDVDDLNADGTIHHAFLLINGRCAMSTGDALTQLQYQLTRAFGRVLGVGWSQLNDDVFTGSPTPTAAEATNWPLMHPIDVICGPFTYQCMRDPFRLRDDDIATLVWLYPVTAQNAIAGKTDPSRSIHKDSGQLTFATGQGMQLVNVTVRRGQPYTTASENALLVSSVVGVTGQQYVGNPVVAVASDAMHSAGSSDPRAAAQLYFPYLPEVGESGYDVFTFQTESINPLYTGDYAVAPYLGEAPGMSGSVVTTVDGVAGPGGWGWQPMSAAADAAATCAPGSDGTESQPMVGTASGFWTGQLCSNGHTSWFTVPVKAGRSFTVEATALDEGGGASTHKARPVLGAWLAGDAVHTLPTVAAQGTAFNALATGVTALRVDAATSARTLRMVVADERGFGRPDFNYSARVLYVDAVSPVSLPAAGGTITITGEGFRGGNGVLVSGVAAKVVSWTPNTIVATAPTMTAAGATSSAPVVNVSVVDSFTGGSSVAQGVLTYSGSDTYGVHTTSSARYIAAGATATWSVGVATVKNGMSASGITVSWSAGAGLTLASASSNSDSAGNAAVSVSTTWMADGSASSVTGCVAAGVCAAANVYGIAASQWAVSVASGAGQSVPATQTLAPVTLAVRDAGGHPLQSATIAVHQTVTSWQAACPVHGRCPAAAILAYAQSTVLTDENGLAVIVPLEVAGVPVTVNIAAASGTQGFTALTLTKTP